MVTAKPILMSASTIEDRLQSHSCAFTSLLELIPAKYYYGGKDDTSQWNKRKQTKAQSVIAKKARLNPDALGVELESEPKPADKQEKFEDKSERKGRREKKSTIVAAPVIPTGEDGGDEGDDNKGIEEAQGIALDNFTFATELDASPPPPTTSISDREYGITTTTAAGAEEPTTAARKPDQRASLAAKIQGLRGKRGGHPPPTTVSTDKSSRRKNAEAKRRKKNQRRQKTGQRS